MCVYIYIYIYMITSELLYRHAPSAALLVTSDNFQAGDPKHIKPFAFQTKYILKILRFKHDFTLNQKLNLLLLLLPTTYHVTYYY